jgi:hypothetical protein
VPTAIVSAGAPASLIKLSNGTLSVAAADVNGIQRLILSRFTVDTPQPIHTRNPFKITFQVTDTRGYVVRDALVYIIGLPYNRIPNLPEQKTLQDGTVTFTLAPTKLQPLKLGARIVLFARARVEGTNVVRGATSQRLIEVVFGAPIG